MGLNQCGLGTQLTGLAFFELFTGHQVTQALVTAAFTLSLGQGFLAVGHGGLGLTQCQLEAFLVNHKQHLITADGLVVTHIHLLDQARHVGGDLHNVGADMGVTGPGSKHVVHGHAPDHDAGKRHHQQGENDTAQGQ